MRTLSIIGLAAVVLAALALAPGRSEVVTAQGPDVHYECYVISDAPPGVSVHLETQFGKEDVEVGPASLLCPPVLKTVLPQGAPEGDLTATHLKCYDIVGRDPQHIVDLETQFGLEEDVEVGPAQRLCVPVVKIPIEPPGPPSGDLLSVPHYECFQIPNVPPDPPVDVLLENQFNLGFPEGPIPVLAASLLCAPALKTILPDGQPEGDLDAPHLKCYDIVAQPPGWAVQLITQFGIEGPLQVGPGQMLCVPALKTLKYVGGIADFPDDEASPLSDSDSAGGSAWPYAAVAGGLAAAAIVLAAGGIYARRRFVR